MSQAQAQPTTRLDPRAIAPLATMAFLIAAMAAFLVSTSQPGTFAASATLGEATTERALGPGEAEVEGTQQRLELYARVAQSGPILQLVIERMGLEMSMSA